MENAAKALLIAAGMFLAVLLLSLLVVFYNQISDFYAQEHELTVMEQNYKFNAKFENYNRDDIRGSDLISFMNRIIDYNATESYFEDKRYERIKVNIHIGTENTEAFRYEIDGSKVGKKNELITAKITNTTGGADDYVNDKQLVAITNTSVKLCEELSTLGVENPTDTQLQQLSSKISSIILDDNGDAETADWAKSSRFKRANLLKDLLGLEVEIDSTTGITTPDLQNQKIIATIKDITSEYYQYTMFKRAYFNCTEVRYDPETNRIVEMNFELKTENGNVVFN